MLVEFAPGSNEQNSVQKKVRQDVVEEKPSKNERGATATAASVMDGKGKRRGLFPRMSLKAVLELPVAIYKIGEGETVRRLTVMDRLGRSPDSGSSRALIVAANSGYGLVQGGYAAEFLGLSDRGMKISSAQDEPSRHEAAYEALFSNDIFAGFVQRFFQKSPPNQEIAVEFLKKTYGLSGDDANACHETIQQNLLDWGLVKEMSGRPVIFSREMGLESVEANGREGGQETSAEPEVSRVPTPPVRPLSPQMGTKQLNQAAAVVPQFHFNIQVHIPADATPDAYEAIFKSIATHLLGRNEE